MNEKRKKLLLNILKLAVAFASFELSPLLKLLPITIFKLNVNKISTTTNYILSIYTYICLVIILFLMYRKELKIEWQRFKNHFAKNMDTAFKYYFIGLLGIDYTFQNQLEILYILPYGILGGTFAYMDYEVDSVFPSITMHMLHNTLLTILSILV